MIERITQKRSAPIDWGRISFVPAFAGTLADSSDSTQLIYQKYSHIHDIGISRSSNQKVS